MLELTTESHTALESLLASEMLSVSQQLAAAPAAERKSLRDKLTKDLDTKHAGLIAVRASLLAYARYMGALPTDWVSTSESSIDGSGRKLSLSRAKSTSFGLSVQVGPPPSPSGTQTCVPRARCAVPTLLV